MVYGYSGSKFVASCGKTLSNKVVDIPGWQCTIPVFKLYSSLESTEWNFRNDMASTVSGLEHYRKCPANTQAEIAAWDWGDRNTHWFDSCHLKNLVDFVRYLHSKFVCSNSMKTTLSYIGKGSSSDSIQYVLCVKMWFILLNLVFILLLSPHIHLWPLTVQYTTWQVLISHRTCHQVLYLI